MADKIGIEIEVIGSDAGATELEKLRIAEQQAGEAAQQFASQLRELQQAEGDNTAAIRATRLELVRAQEAQREATRKANEHASSTATMSQQITQAVGAVGALASGLNAVVAATGQSNTEIGHAAQSFAGIATAAGSGAAAFGPWGALLGVATAGVAELANAIQNNRAELERHQRAISDYIRAVGDLATSNFELKRSFDELNDGLGGIEETESQLATVVARHEAANRDLNIEAERGIAIQAQLAQAQADLDHAGQIRGYQGRFEATGRANEAIRTLTAQLEVNQAKQERLNATVRQAAEAQQRLNAALSEAIDLEKEKARIQEDAAREEENRRNAAIRRERARAAAEEGRQRIEEAEERRFESFRYTEERIAELRAARLESEREYYSILKELENERRQNTEDKARQEYQTQLELADQQHERELAKLENAKQQQRAATEKIKADATGVLTPVVSQLTDALSAVMAGTKSAEEAFQGLLSSFLEMIAQRAVIEAVAEYAAAVASFASYQYDAGALHLAAGAAWTGVAVLAGAAAVATAPATGVPSEPQSQPTQGGSGGGTNVFNINGTIVSADGYSARSKAGRDLGVLIADGTGRYGRAA